MKQLAKAIIIFALTFARNFLDGAILTTLNALPLWILWNNSIPDVFDLKPISLGQAFWLSALLTLLFAKGEVKSEHNKR